MAEIKTHRFLIWLLHRRRIFYLPLLLLFPVSIYSQTSGTSKSGKKKIEVKWADQTVVNPKFGRDVSRLLGNVSIVHNDISMKCDSAYFYEKANQVRAFSKIHIEQGDTLDLYGDYLFYDGTEEKAFVTGNVELINNETHLFTDTVNYDVKSKTAYYPDKGRITNTDNVLTSLLGVYYISQKMFHFKDSVRVVNPDYVMVADTLEFNTETEKAFIFGPTNINGDSIHIYSERGWYDSKQKISRLWKKSSIDNLKQIVYGDSLYYEEATGFGRAYGNVIISDTSRNIMVRGNKALYYKDPEKFLMTDSARYIQISENDTMFLHADTIRSDTYAGLKGSTYRVVKAYFDCRIFSNEIQARCDSLTYSFLDSVARLYKSPVVWAEENQLTGDSIALFTKNSQVVRMELYNTAFIVSKVDTLSFNQTRGRNLIGYFKDNELDRIVINGNGETIYFLLDGEELIGVNQAKSASMEIFVENGEIKDIYEYDNPEGNLDPPRYASPEKLRLPGFKWLDSSRPKKMMDIFLDN